MSDLEKLKAMEAEAELAEAEEFEDDEEYDEDDDEEGGEADEIEVDTELFAEQVLRFSCFAEAPKDKDADELFDVIFAAYEDENLTEEQDHAVEFLLHIQEEDSPFNLSRALEVWNKSDRQAFLSIVQDVSESLDHQP